MPTFEQARTVRDRWANILIQSRDTNPELFEQRCHEFNQLISASASAEKHIPFDIVLAIIGLASLQMDLAVRDNPPQEKDPE